MREMNEIERKFYDAFCDYYNLKDFDDEDEHQSKLFHYEINE